MLNFGMYLKSKHIEHPAEMGTIIIVIIITIIIIIIIIVVIAIVVVVIIKFKGLYNKTKNLYILLDQQVLNFKKVCHNWYLFSTISRYQRYRPKITLQSL